MPSSTVNRRTWPSIHRVIEKTSGPARTLHEAFAGTDELVRAYLRAVTPAFVDRAITDAHWSPPAAKRYPGEVVEEVVTQYRD